MAANEDHTTEADVETSGVSTPPLQVDPTNPFAVPENLIEVLKATAPRRPAAQDDEDEDDDRRAEEAEDDDPDAPRPSVSRRRRKRRRGAVDMELEGGEDGDPENTVTRVRAPRASSAPVSDTVQGVKGSTRLEAKRQRRRDSRTGGRRRTVITEAEFLARRESVDRKMLVRQRDSRIQIAVLEDGVLAEHFVSNTTQDSLIGNVYLGKVQNVLPSMEAAFVDIGRGRNAVLYAGEVNWDAAQLDGRPKKIENALKSGDTVLVQVTKDPVGHKGARLTSQISLPGRYLVYVPGGSMTGISRKLPDVERARLKRILKDHLPQDAGVIVRTAAEGTSEQELQNDINRLRAQWEGIQAKAASTKVLAPEMLSAEPDLTIKTVRDVFNEDFSAMLVQGEDTWDSIEAYVTYVAPHLLDRLHHWVPEDHDGEDLYATHRVDEQLHKALDRKVYLPSGGSLVIDRTEAMTVVDVNTGKFTGSGGNLEETVTKNNLEAAEEIVRQLRLRDIGGIIVIDFIDMVLEANRDLVLRRLVECLGRDRTKHQVAEVTSLGLVQMTRKRMGTGLVEVFSETCEHCAGRGIVIHDAPVERGRAQGESRADGEGRRRRRRRGAEAPSEGGVETAAEETSEEERLRRERAAAARAALRSIVKATVKTEEPADAAPVAEDAVAEEAGPPAVEAAGAADAQPSTDVPAGEVEASEDGLDEEHGGRRRRRRGRRRGRGRGEEAPGAAEDAETEAAVEAVLTEEVEERTADEEAALAPVPASGEEREATRVELGAPEQDAAPGADAEDAVPTAHAEDAVPAGDGPAGEPEDDEPRASRRGRRRRGGRSRSRHAESAPEDAATRPDSTTEETAAAEPEAAPAAPSPRVPEPEGSASPVIAVDGEPVSVPRRRGRRRATSDGAVTTASDAAAAGLKGIEDALDRRVVRAEQDPPAAGDPASVQVRSAAASTRRRSRRAVSADGRQVQVQEGGRAAAGSRFTAAAGAAPVPAPEADEAPVMLGVGVKAADLARR